MNLNERETKRALFRQLIVVGCAVLLSYLVMLPAQAEEASMLIAQGDQQWAEGKLDLAQKAFEQGSAPNIGSGNQSERHF